MCVTRAPPPLLQVSSGRNPLVATRMVMLTTANVLYISVARLSMDKDECDEHNQHTLNKAAYRLRMFYALRISIKSTPQLLLLLT